MNDSTDILFQPLHFPNLTLKNRVLRSNIAGRFGNYDGSEGDARIRWEESFAKGGVGAIISSYVPVAQEGRILPNYATLTRSNQVSFWAKLIDRVHRYDCKYIMQLSHSGRQRDAGGVDNFDNVALSSTNSSDPFHGIPCRAMTTDEVKKTVEQFADAAEWAKAAGADGVELHGANGYLITQFLSSAINDRTDRYGGPLENRAQFVREIVRAIRARVGSTFHLQMKINAEDHNDVLNPFGAKGNTLPETIQVCQWLEVDGVDAFHISTGSLFPHPLNPPGPLPLDYAERSYPVMMASGNLTLRNYIIFRYRALRPFFRSLWERHQRGRPIEGINADLAAQIKERVRVPVLCTGGFQRASLARRYLESGRLDAVTIARPLIANRDLLDIWKRGDDLPERPCTFCNKCLVYAPAYPLGCYEESRFDGDYDEMIKQVYRVYEPYPEPRCAPSAESSQTGAEAE